MKLQKIFSGLHGLMLVLLCLMAGQAMAVPVTGDSLGLEGQGKDITSMNLDLEYNVTTEEFSLFSAWGPDIFCFHLNADLNCEQTISDGLFSIEGTANQTNADLSLLITGNLPSVTTGTEILLAGELLQLGAPGTGTIEFLFGNLTGALAGQFGNFAGVTVGGFMVDFTQDVSGSWGTANTFEVPAPGALSLMLLGLAGLVFMRRRSVSATRTA